MNNYSTKTTAKIRNFFDIKEKMFLQGPKCAFHKSLHPKETHYLTAYSPPLPLHKKEKGRQPLQPSAPLSKKSPIRVLQTQKS